MTDWNKMPVAQKSALIRMFIENGITDLNQMRHIYAEAGIMDDLETQEVVQEPQPDILPGNYTQWMHSLALKLSEVSNNSYIFTLCDIANNRDFDYSGMYNDDPRYAWSLLDDGNPDFYEIGKIMYGEPKPVMDESEQAFDTKGDINRNEFADGGGLEHPVPPEYNDMAKVITKRYRNLNFVQRALNPENYPYIEDEEDDRLTHLMEVSDDGAGTYFIYPTVIQKYADSGLEVLDSDDAFSHAMRTGEYITVPNKDFAGWYSSNGLIDHLHDSEGNEYAEGGKIHIKKENKGKFTAAAKRAGKSVQEYARQILANKKNYSPTLVKRANFARNASKWHADGGFLNPDDPPYRIKPVDFVGQVAQGQAERGVTQADKTRVVTPLVSVTQIEKERQKKNADDVMAQHAGYKDAETMNKAIQMQKQQQDQHGNFRPLSNQEMSDVDAGYAVEELMRKDTKENEISLSSAYDTPYNETLALQAREIMRNRKVPDVPYVDRKPGESCINTATGAYGNEYQQYSNQLFTENHDGYVEIPIDVMRPGDLYQQWHSIPITTTIKNILRGRPQWKNREPVHMVMLDSITPYGQYLFDYSNGSEDPNDSSAIKHQVPFLELWEDDNFLYGEKAKEYMKKNGKAFRFVGDH